MDPALVDQAEQALRTTPRVLGVGQVRLRWIGHAECEVIVDTAASAVQAHQVAVSAEHNLLHALPRLAAALVHADPQAQAGTAQEGTWTCLRHREVTMTASRTDGPAGEPPGQPGALPGGSGCRVHEVLERVGDKWSLFVIFRLGGGPQRFTALLRSVDGISQRMLTVTLRGLERDGIVSRTMYPVMPPRVDYELTKMGHTLLDAVGALMDWADTHLHEIGAARAAYDARAVNPAPPARPPMTSQLPGAAKQGAPQA